MSQPVNLNRFRKAKARTDKKTRADENAVKFGRTKVQKSFEDARAQKATAKIDAHRLESERDPE